MSANDSPTAVAFGTQSHFPPAHRRALFILDWAYGRIVMVHTSPRGASYACHAETFIKGRPFNVTSLAFGKDGALYVVTGGRKTQSGLYRIRYVGPEVPDTPPTAQQKARAEHSAKARGLRHQLEAMSAEPAKAALDELWPHAIALGWQALWVAVILNLGARMFRRTVLKSGRSKPWWRLKRA